MFYVTNFCSLYLGWLKYFTGTLRGNHLLFVPSEQADAQHNDSLCLEYLIFLGFGGFFPAKIEFVVNVYYFISLKTVYV